MGPASGDWRPAAGMQSVVRGIADECELEDVEEAAAGGVRAGRGY